MWSHVPSCKLHLLDCYLASIMTYHCFFTSGQVNLCKAVFAYLFLWCQRAKKRKQQATISCMSTIKMHTCILNKFYGFWNNFSEIPKTLGSTQGQMYLKLLFYLSRIKSSLWLSINSHPHYHRDHQLTLCISSFSSCTGRDAVQHTALLLTVKAIQ